MIVSTANTFNDCSIFNQKSFLAKINFTMGDIIPDENLHGKNNHQPSNLVSFISSFTDRIPDKDDKNKNDNVINKISYDFIDFCNFDRVKSEFNPILILPLLSYLEKRNEDSNFRFIACSEFPLTMACVMSKTMYTDQTLINHILSTFDDEFEYCDASDFVKYLITNDARLDNIRTHKKKIILTY